MAADKRERASIPPPLSGAAAAVKAGAQDNGAAVSGEHAVLVEFSFTSDLQRITQLEDKLRAAIEAAKVGEFDGNELAVDGSHGRLYMYGPNADRLFDVVRPILEASPLMKDATAIKRYGPPGDTSKETRVKLGETKGQ